MSPKKQKPFKVHFPLILMKLGLEKILFLATLALSGCASLHNLSYTPEIICEQTQFKTEEEAEYFSKKQIHHSAVKRYCDLYSSCKDKNKKKLFLRKAKEEYQKWEEKEPGYPFKFLYLNFLNENGE
jgi:hypothetical protein